MRHKTLIALIALACIMASTACSKLERLSIIRPTAERGDYTRVAPDYDVSDKGRKGASLPTAKLLALAIDSYQTGHAEQARKQAQQVLKSDPASADAHTLLGLLDSNSGQNAAAGKHYAQALAIAPGNGAYANNYGSWLCGNGQPAESLAFFDAALADANYPTPLAALANAGNCAQQAGQPMRAETSWRQALVLDPESASALSGMANLQFNRGKYMDARAFVQRWLAIAPQDTNALRLALQIEQKQGDNVAAQRYLLRLQAIAPDASTVPSKQ